MAEIEIVPRPEQREACAPEDLSDVSGSDESEEEEFTSIELNLEPIDRIRCDPGRRRIAEGAFRGGPGGAGAPPRSVRCQVRQKSAQETPKTRCSPWPLWPTELVLPLRGL